MNDIFTVMKFTMKDMLKRKSFIITTIVITIAIIIGFNIPNIIKAFKSNDGSEKILIYDVNNIFEDNLTELENLDLGYEFILSNESIDNIKDMVLNDKISSALIINKENDSIKIDCIVKNMMFNEAIPDNVYTALTTMYKNIQIEKLNLSEKQLSSINPTFDINVTQVEDEIHGNIFAMMMISILLFYAVYFCALQVSSSITTEKTSKIIETLVTSTSPKNIVLGKTIGVGVVGLLQMVLFISTAFVSAKLFVDSELLNSVLDFSSITLSLGIVTLLYFILGYFMFALLYALAGSTVSKPEDIPSANSPVAIISLIGFYLAYFTLMNPNSNLNLLAAMLPISSAFCMPLRIMMGISNTKEVLLSLLILATTILITAKITIKIYSNAILNYGTKFSIKNIIKLYKQK